MKDNFSDDLYRVNLPYPPVTLTQNDRRYAALLSDAYAGKGSETTAIAQYRVHRLYLKKYPEIASAYQQISAVEMLHQDLLGNLVLRLGCPPKLCSRTTGQYWNGSFPMYRSQILLIFESDAEQERHAIAHYAQLIQTIPNESVQTLFKRIILDEELHLHYLEALIAKYK